MLVCDGCGEREREPSKPWYRLEMMLGQRRVRSWDYCSLGCITRRKPDRAKGGVA